MENQQQQVQSTQSVSVVKRRNAALCVLFSIITFGIYGIYWFVCLTNDTNNLSKIKTASGGKAVLFTIITFGVYSFYWFFKLGQKVGDFDKGSSKGALYLILSFIGLGFVDMILAQCALNRKA